MPVIITPEDLKLDRGRFPYSMTWKGKIVAYLYSSGLLEPFRKISVSTFEINRLILEKNRLLDYIDHTTGDISDIKHESPIILSIVDEVTPVGDIFEKAVGITLDSIWTSKNGDPYVIKEIDSKKETVLLSWLKGKYTREVTFKTLTKNYKPYSELGGLDGDDVDNDD